MEILRSPTEEAVCLIHDVFKREGFIDEFELKIFTLGDYDGYDNQQTQFYWKLNMLEELVKTSNLVIGTYKFYILE